MGFKFSSNPNHFVVPGEEESLLLCAMPENCVDSIQAFI